MKNSLVYIHIGNELPNYLYDNIYQTLLINNYATNIYVCMNDNLINKFYNEINKFNLNVYTKSDFYFNNVIQAVPLSILDQRLKTNVSFTTYKNILTTKFPINQQFRDGFWVSTTSRFFYIYELMRLFQLKNVFHIENDVILYENIDNLRKFLHKYFEIEKIDKVCMVQDAPGRVIPSILYFENSEILCQLVNFIPYTLQNIDVFINDMNILGLYPEKYELPLEPNKHLMIFDGAAIGQYLGGVDPKNISEVKDIMLEYINPTRGFINETAKLNPNNLTLIKTNVYIDHLDIPAIIYLTNYKQKIQDIKYNRIVNLHIHSKQLYQFSSIWDINIMDIISGDRVLALCDFVIATKDIFQFHKNMGNYSKDIILVNDFNNINIELLHQFFNDHFKKTQSRTIKLFIYTHILEHLVDILTDKINKMFKFVIYTHNSDHHFNKIYKKLVDSEQILHIYAQNIDYPEYNNKLTLLPIGIANSMWVHGDIVSLYTVIKETYKNNRIKSIYVNINPNTYNYRREILDKIVETKCYDLSSGKPYIEYLRELAEHRFCLCIRGNGVDTHRFWESLYLGVIPVIINNNTTRCENFIKYLQELDIPFVEIKNDDLDVFNLKYNKEYFSENLYKNMIKKSKGIYNLKSLKISNYKYE